LTDYLIRSSILFAVLYQNVDGYNISKAARKKVIGNSGEFLYGETLFQSWKKIVENANPKKDGVFFDLGSGVGRSVIASHLLFDFQKSVGFEMLEDLHNQALETKELLYKIADEETLNRISKHELQFVRGNFFEIDFYEADLVFLNYHIRNSQKFLDLEKKLLQQLKPGSKIITALSPLRNPAFKMFDNQSYKFSWGSAPTYFYEV